jgi:hypothetical protein
MPPFMTAIVSNVWVVQRACANALEGLHKALHFAGVFCAKELKQHR